MTGTFDPSSPVTGDIHVVADAEDPFKVGERVTHRDGRFGTVERITGNLIRVKGDDGEVFTVKYDQLEKLRT